ncbi:MAG: hypothetical protein JW915_10530 [Chitinispirillaceae bacterium]|nr:hypothetical protein [Chitinispirillaceae bacterium]
MDGLISFFGQAFIVFLFLCFIVVLLRKGEIRKLRLEILEWLKLDIERDTTPSQAQTNKPSLSNKPDEPAKDIPIMDCHLLHSNMDRIHAMAREIKQQCDKEKVHFPINLYWLRRIKRLRENYDKASCIKSGDIHSKEILPLIKESQDILNYLSTIN